MGLVVVSSEGACLGVISNMTLFFCLVYTKGRGASLGSLILLVKGGYSPLLDASDAFPGSLTLLSLRLCTSMLGKPVLILF